ncbi:MAG: alpha/beta fold hydrolase [Acidimicrobiales bacterium]
MERFASFDGIEIAYDVLAAGERPVLLLHGFASTARLNWIRPGLTAALTDARRSVIVLDARGHGESDAPHDQASYAGGAMVRDVISLLDHLGVREVDVAGYSMGSFVAMSLATRDARVLSLFLGGAGTGQVRIRRPQVTAAIAEALEAEDPNTIEHPSARAFRSFADATHSDRIALAAVQRATQPPTGEELGRIGVPTLVVNGDRDTLIGDPTSLSDLIPGARCLLVPGNHMSAVVRPEFRDALVAWAETGRVRRSD